MFVYVEIVVVVVVVFMVVVVLMMFDILKNTLIVISGAGRGHSGS